MLILSIACSLRCGHAIAISVLRCFGRISSWVVKPDTLTVHTSLNVILITLGYTSRSICTIDTLVIITSCIVCQFADSCELVLNVLD